MRTFVTKKRWTLRSIGLALATFPAVAACATAQGGDGGGQGQGGEPADAGPSGGFIDAKPSSPEFNDVDAAECGGASFELTPGEPPELVLVLDRSSSMTPPDRWPAIAAAVKGVIGALQGQIKWGLELFPSGADSCGDAAGVDVAVDVMNAATISTAIDATAPGGNTPTYLGVRHGREHLAARTTTNPKFMILATDGWPSCSEPPVIGQACVCPDAPGFWPSTTDAKMCCSGDPTAFQCGLCEGFAAERGAFAELRAARAAGIKTFVIGFKLPPQESPQTLLRLNALADEGGVPRAGAVKYYPADTAADVIAAIETITGQILDCRFTLATPPPDPSLVQVLVDGVQVPYDPAGQVGWSYGASSQEIVLHGQECANVKAGLVKQVKAVFGCPPVVVE
jgi:hypothetical protein